MKWIWLRVYELPAVENSVSPSALINGGSADRKVLNCVSLLKCRLLHKRTREHQFQMALQWTVLLADVAVAPHLHRFVTRTSGFYDPGLVEVFVLFFAISEFESVCFSVATFWLRSCPSPGSMRRIMSNAQQLGARNRTTGIIIIS